MQFAESRTCPQCGKVFVANSPCRRYCTDDCCDEARKIRAAARYKNIALKVCEHCGRRYKPTHKEQKYCSRACGGREYNKNYQKRKVEPMRECRVLITREVEVDPEMRPVVGKNYRAFRPAFKSAQLQAGFYIIPEIGKYGLIVRDNECREVNEDG